MTILVVGENQNDPVGVPWNVLVYRLVTDHPDCRFVFAGDLAEQYTALPNVSTVSGSKKKPLPLLKNLNRKARFRKMTEESGASLALFLNQVPIPGVAASCCLVGDDTGATLTKTKPKAWFKSAATNRIPGNKTFFIAASAYGAARMGEAGFVEKNEVTVLVPPVEDLYQPLSREQKESIKEKWTAGHEYFICDGTKSNDGAIIDLLKAFSMFKKRQMSGMKLVLTGVGEDRSIGKKISTYKYRQDVVLAGDIPTPVYTLLLGAAYACLEIKPAAGFSVARAKAIASGIPLVSVFADTVPVSEAVLIAEAGTEGIAKAMMQLYKDENLRVMLANRAGQERDSFNAATQASKLWSLISGLV